MKKLSLYLFIGFALAIAFLVIRHGDARALDQNGCLSCHGNEGLAKTTGTGARVSLYVNVKGVDVSAHRYIDCTNFHTAEPHTIAPPLTKLSLAEKCGTCHQYEYQLHIQSIHGQQLRQGNKDVATCVDCHSPD